MIVKGICFILFMSLFFLSFADDPIVLQNGSDSYNGCDDTYLVTAENYTQKLNDNFGDEDYLKVWS